jgi:hypothetical protein
VSPSSPLGFGCDTGRYESREGLLRLVHAAEADAWLSLGLAAVLNSLPLSAQLATVSGSLWSRVLQVTEWRMHETHNRTKPFGYLPSCQLLDDAMRWQMPMSSLLQ